VLDPRVDAKAELVPSLEEAIGRVVERWQDELAGALQSAGAEGRPEIARRQHGEEIPEAVLRAAGELGASVVATETAAGGVLRDAFLGSAALNMLGKADVPVLLSRASEGPAGEGEYRVFFTTDGSPASEAALPALLPLITAGNLPVTLWRSLESPDADPADARRRMEALAATLPSSVECEVVVDSEPTASKVAARIVASAGAAGACVIAMATHGHSARYNLLTGSVAMAVLKESPLPVLMVRAGNSIEPRL
jgi:nucleotide-binding universal stress UspA family protein